ncbi:cation diffusion facilitator family transporter [Pelotomaculum terephthalicicum JT]|uniref:Cation diffusion facilitator family transporter n=1 Tax=Pelotomaculum isophthalicicum JI TaxID=947010 RepID=A0A9X4H2Z2_9FIRM|nr:MULTISPECIES: cation diffusion facilitator family transporter [Pelotomaculum]MCG9967060.1 cation diffusion facilitator family transporter [Pelotomaculum terephthalicicum JT]MDF9409270.1 cation diffusion facilitator family transporter [Pelotomaculum isophthalicicum JI]OPX87381.1 MAG: ferrous iron efflux protein F [Pelotomaculum sp. PtaB.Bin013]OPY63894.1 MAG: ferrous iron efflux protein F [Pelotomaculum sp. PtaU1.Bin065]
MDPADPSRLKNGVLSNLGLFIVKGSVALSCGSAAIYASTLYSLSNTLNDVFSLLGLKMASRPADAEHPFGYGKELYFWSFIAAVFMLGFASMGAVGRGLKQIKEQYVITSDILPVLALAIAFLYECFLLKSALARSVPKEVQDSDYILKNYIRLFKRNTNPTNQIMVLQSTAAVIGTGVSLSATLIASWTGSYLFDGLASICVGLLCGSMALILAFQLKELIIGCSACPDTVRLINNLAMQVPGVTDVPKIKTMFIGSHSLLVNMEIKVKSGLDIESIEDINDEIEKIIKINLGSVRHINIETFADDMVQDWKRKTDFYFKSKTVSEVM